MTTTSTPSGTAADGRVAPTAGRTSTPRPAGGQARRRPKRDTLAGYVFLSPWLIGFVGLTLGPMLMSLYFAFTDYNLFTRARVGRARRTSSACSATRSSSSRCS